MSDGRIDQIVKGAAPPEVQPPAIAPLVNLSSVSATHSESPPAANSSNDNQDNDNDIENNTTPGTSSTQPIDPFSSLPSSPPQIYLNLLILESSLRAQYLQLLSRRRLHTLFVLLLLGWTGLFTYLLFLRPREDGLGLGGSVYWVVETMEKVALMGGAVTIVLFWGTGQWERGIRWPRRWVGTTNRGLRGFNLRVVVMRGPWWKEWPKYLAFLLPTMNLQGSGSDWHLVEYSRKQHGGRHQHPHHQRSGGTPANIRYAEKSEDEDEHLPDSGGVGGLIEEDLASGGDYIRLLLLPKSFSPEFRENWEGYRSDYWGRENERRAVLRRKSRSQRRARAKNAGGWTWWLGLWRLRRQHPLPPSVNLASSTTSASSNRRDLERQHSASRASLLSSSSASAGGGGGTAGKRRSSFLRSDSHTNTNTNTNTNTSNSSSSRHSSRSSSSRRTSTRHLTLTDSSISSISNNNEEKPATNAMAMAMALNDPSYQHQHQQQQNPQHDHHHPPRTRRGSSSRRKAVKEKDRNVVAAAAAAAAGGAGGSGSASTAISSSPSLSSSTNNTGRTPSSSPLTRAFSSDGDGES